MLTRTIKHIWGSLGGALAELLENSTEGLAARCFDTGAGGRPSLAGQVSAVGFAGESRSQVAKRNSTGQRGIRRATRSHIRRLNQQ